MRMPRRRDSWAAWIAAWLLVVGAVRSEGADRAASFAPAERRRIDENALWGPRERIDRPTVQATGSLLQWLVVHAPLPAEEERRRAEAAVRQAEATLTVRPTPEAAKAEFDRLLAAMPDRQRPPNGHAGLLVVADAERKARLVGLGRVVVDEMWLNAVLSDAPAGRDRLAFVVAHELSRGALGHVRRRWQRSWLEEELRRSAERKDQPAADRERTLRMLESLHGLGTIYEHVYTREEDYQSDLFAVHLCRNAGFDVEHGLDVLRAAAVRDDSALLREQPPRTGTPPVEPEIETRKEGEEMVLAKPPTAAQRLRRLRLELDGLVYGEFGLDEFDRATKTFRRANDGSGPTDAPSVVCLHGMESSREAWRPLLTRLAAEMPATTKLYAFQYPADDSLARAGRFLQRELRRVFGDAKPTDFVAHSAGGLVFRWYAEVEGGAFRRAIFLGTPHQGSDLARLRGLLEAVQFAGDVPLGYDTALQKAIVDGRGQMTFDLSPDSLFLRHLNRPRPGLQRDRYAIHCGQALSPGRRFALRTSVDASRTVLARRWSGGGDSLLATYGKSALAALTLPAEILDGDLCVTSASARLEDVTTVETHPLSHTALPRDPAVVALVAKRLASAP